VWPDFDVFSLLVRATAADENCALSVLPAGRSFLTLCERSLCSDTAELLRIEGARFSLRLSVYTVVAACTYCAIAQSAVIGFHLHTVIIVVVAIEAFYCGPCWTLHCVVEQKGYTAGWYFAYCSWGS